MTQQINIDELTPDQIAKIEQDIINRKKQEAKKRDDEIKTYKHLVKQTVGQEIINLQEINHLLSIAKADVFGSFSAIIAMKRELFGVKSGQQSHTFSDDNGNTISLGYRVIDKYDDTLDEGIAIVREYINSLAVDDNTSKLVDKLNKLLKKDAKGNLRPNRVMELQAMADEENDEKLNNGVEIIRKSYKPVRSAIFIEAECTGADQKKQNIALSITSVDFPEGFTADFDVFKD